jgi:hypothetical protein
MRRERVKEGESAGNSDTAGHETETETETEKVRYTGASERAGTK